MTVFEMKKPKPDPKYAYQIVNDLERLIERRNLYGHSITISDLESILEDLRGAPEEDSAVHAIEEIRDVVMEFRRRREGRFA